MDGSSVLYIEHKEQWTIYHDVLIASLLLFLLCVRIAVRKMSNDDIDNEGQRPQGKAHNYRVSGFLRDEYNGSGS